MGIYLLNLALAVAASRWYSMQGHLTAAAASVRRILYLEAEIAINDR